MIFNVKKITIPQGSVVKITDHTGIVLWQKENEPITTATPMFFKNIDSVPITIGVQKTDENAYTATLQTSTDGINWEDWGSTSTTALTKSVPVGDKLYVKATSNVGYFNNNNSSYYNYFTSDGKVNVGGNIMSLGYKDFEDKTSSSQYAYEYVFYNMANLVDASKLILPATTLKGWCYYHMFQGCTSLTTAPALPADTLASGCYSNMFRGCTSLTTAPALPATTLASSCYAYMFDHCTSLTTAPALPATTLADNCYYQMFSDCTSLTEAPALPATTLTDHCYSNMFRYCSSLTTAPALPATTLADNCYYCMFWNCTRLTEAPELPATTLASQCYYYMFKGCTRLNKVTTYANDISASNCLYKWLDGVSNTGDFYNEGGANYEIDSASGIPTGWTEHKQVDYSKYPFFIENAGGDFNKVTLLKNNENAYTANLQIGVPMGDKDDLSNIWWYDAFDTSTSGRSYSLAYKQRIYFRATGNVGYLNSDTGNHNFFQSDDNVSVGGNIMSLGYNEFEDKVSINQASAYNRVFYNMSKLVDASKLVLPATTLKDYCYQNMFYGCTSLTEAPALPATTLASNCYRYMFQGCTALTTAPALPATTLASNCYQNMFRGCASLTTAPALPAETLVYNCYNYMFNGCSKLNYIKAMFTTTPSTTYTQSWVSGVASTGTFVKNVNATWNTTGTTGVPKGWTIETASN